MIDIAFGSFFFLIILLFSIIIHEVAHGLMAEKLGDSTAREAGRITLNPIPHIDLIGSILLPGILWLVGSPLLFGWAKPVPVNPYNFHKPKYGMAKVAVAGAAANLLIAYIFGGFIRLLLYREILLALLPLFGLIVIVNIILALFNLLPIPPLDGSHILFTFLPASMQNIKMFIMQYGIFLLIGFIFLGGFRLLLPIILMVFYLFTGVNIEI